MYQFQWTFFSGDSVLRVQEVLQLGSAVEMDMQCFRSSRVSSLNMECGVLTRNCVAHEQKAESSMKCVFLATMGSMPYLMGLAVGDAYRHMCFACGKRYKTRSKLNRHVRYECGAARNQLQCRVCGRRFSRPDNLRQHGYLHALQKL